MRDLDQDLWVQAMQTGGLRLAGEVAVAHARDHGDRLAEDGLDLVEGFIHTPGGIDQSALGRNLCDARLQLALG